MDFQDPVTVYTLTDIAKAEIIKNYLISEGIQCILDSESAFNPVGLPIAMEIAVLVPAKDADRATRLISQHEEHHRK
jgi:hypothetical protein